MCSNSISLCSVRRRRSAYRDQDRPLIHALMRERKTRAVKRAVKVLVLGDDGESPEKLDCLPAYTRACLSLCAGLARPASAAAAVAAAVAAAAAAAYIH